MQSKLTGIERELVLKYLQDANVPVTVTPIESSADALIHSATSAVFPVAVQPEKMTVLTQGIILLKNPPQSAESFAGKMVRVEFYFNHLGLCFTTKMTQVSSGLALVIPSEINRISETPLQKTNSFKADVYFSGNDNNTIHILCSAAEGYQLFSKPTWKDIPLENSVEAKGILEQFISRVKQHSEYGNGIYLIPVCRYLSEKNESLQTIEGRVESPKVLYVNHENMILACDAESFPLKSDVEYSVKLEFPVDVKKLPSRIVEAKFTIFSVYNIAENTRKCAVCRFIDLKEEDLRFIYENTTKKFFV